MRIASSASLTCCAKASASEYTAMVRIPRRFAVRKIRRAISPRFATRRVSITDRPSHAEHAEARVLSRRVLCCGETQRKNAPRFRRINNTVVPQARRRVIGMTLRLVLLPDRLLERFFVRGRPFLTGCLQLVTLYSGQHTRGLYAAHDRNTRIGPLKQKSR